MNVGVLETKNRLSELIDVARQGQDVTITNRGEPVAKLVAVESEADRRKRAVAAMEEMDRVAAAIVARRGRGFIWEDLKESRNDGRP